MTRGSRFRFGKSPILARVALAVGSLAVIALAVDLVAFYVLDLKRMGYDADRFLQPSSLLGLDYRPSVTGTWYPYKDGTRTHVSVNAYGFPDAERTIDKTRARIALMGDHAIEFWEVEKEQRAQHVMEHLLDGRVEVLNFGLRGAGTDVELIRYRHQVMRFSPDIVVLLFTVQNLHDNVTTGSRPYFVLDSDAPGGIRLEGVPVRNQPTSTPATASLRDILEHSFVLRTLKYLAMGTGTHLRVNVPLEQHAELRPFKRVYDGEDERRLELEKRLIEAFANDSRARNIHFLLVEGLYRPALDSEMRKSVVDAYGDQFDFDRIAQAFSDHSREAGYDFLSLPRLVRDRRLEVEALMHPEATMHLNAEGVTLFSTAVVEKIRELGWLDDRRGSRHPLN